MGSRRRAFPRPALAVLAALAASAACLPGAGPPLDPYVDDAGPPPPSSFGTDSGARMDIDLGAAFAITGLQPSHGPWTGGTRTTIAGRGFTSSVQVWIGGAPLPAGDVFASDPTHIAVVTPGGPPGPADVRVHSPTTGNDATLPAGFSYDAFVVTPGTGATTGGTRIALQGEGTHWSAASTVAVGGKPCTGLTFTSATALSCLTPPSAPGSQQVVVQNPDGSIDPASDAFVYSDSPDGYRGGLYGGALAGELTVLGFDSWTGTPLAGKAIAGSTLATALVSPFDGSGVAHFSSPSLQGKVTVTIAAPCHSPRTYVDVPVDTVTAYLDPTLDPACATGDPPSGGNWVPTDDGEIDGELVWNGGIEFQRAAWGNVPAPAGPTQRQAAYVWATTGAATDGYHQPDPSTATTPGSTGQLGYAYALPIGPGNATIYALAGIEDSSTNPPTFEPFAMGVAQGIAVSPGTKVVGVNIPMSTVLDRTLATIPQPPAPAPRGPDRLVSTVAMALRPSAYAILPQGARTTLLPIAGDVSFVGVPALDGTLSGALYALAASAVTGSGQSTPRSVVTSILTSDAADPVTLGGFPGIPVLAQPGPGRWSGTHVQLQVQGPVDLARLDVSSGGGLVTWTIVAPGTDLSFDLPDLAKVSGVDALARGPLSMTFSVARITGFDYGTLRTGQLSSSAWNAYAQDTQAGSY